jgi:hypothetical protein
MRKAEMTCWNCLSFVRKRGVCKEIPVEEKPVENPEENWCGTGCWRDPYDNSKLYWGDWRVFDETKAERFRNSWDNLKKAIDQGDEEWVTTYSSDVIFRSRDIIIDDMLDFMGEEETQKFLAWKSLLFGKSATIKWDEVKKEAQELEYP